MFIPTGCIPDNVYKVDFIYIKIPVKTSYKSYYSLSSFTTLGDSYNFVLFTKKRGFSPLNLDFSVLFKF